MRAQHSPTKTIDARLAMSHTLRPISARRRSFLWLWWTDLKHLNYSVFPPAGGGEGFRANSARIKSFFEKKKKVAAAVKGSGLFFFFLFSFLNQAYGQRGFSLKQSRGDSPRPFF